MIWCSLIGLIAAGTTADLVPPFFPEEGNRVGLWEMGGGSVIHDSVIMLAAPIQYHKGCAWTNVQVPSGDWALNIRMQIYETNGGGGFGVWLVDKYNADGPIFGGPSHFKGFSLVANVDEIPDTSKMKLDFFIIQAGSRESQEMPIPAFVTPFSKQQPFELRIGFINGEIVLSFDGKEMYRDKLQYNLSKRYIGITAANDRRASRFDLHGVEFELLGKSELEGHQETMKGNVNDAYYQPEQLEILRKPSFNITTQELLAKEQEAGVREATIDRLWEVIDELHLATYEVASFSDVNEFVRESLSRFSEKWQKRTMKLVERVRQGRDVAGAAWNYTELMVKNFRNEIQANKAKASGKILSLAEIFNEISQSGIDESGELSGYVNTVNRSKTMTVIMWISFIEFVAVLLFFIVVNLPQVKRKITDVY